MRNLRDVKLHDANSKMKGATWCHLELILIMILKLGHMRHNILPAQRRHIEETISCIQPVRPARITRIRVVKLVYFLQEDAEALLLAICIMTLAFGLQLRLIAKIVLQRLNVLVHAYVEVVVEGRVGGGEPLDVIPARALLESGELLVGSTRDEYEMGVPRIEMLEVGGHLVHYEAAALAGSVSVRVEHDVADDQLAVALEQVLQVECALWAGELIVLIELHEWKLGTLFGKLVGVSRVFLLFRKEVDARLAPLLQGSDLS